MGDESETSRRATATPLAHHVGRPIAAAAVERRHPSQIAVLVIGVVYVVVGVVGLLLDRGRPGAPSRVLGFELGLAHDLIRVNIGLLGLAMWAERRTARSYGRLLSLGYGASVVLGLLGGGQVGFPPLQGPDGLLHLGNAAAAHWPATGNRMCLRPRGTDPTLEGTMHPVRGRSPSGGR